jgi:uncharacterized glyoxalase superfamily protein PhnB
MTRRRDRVILGVMSNLPPPTCWPTLKCTDAVAEIEFLVTLGFERTAVYENDGLVEHAQLNWPEGGGVMLGSYTGQGPWTIKPGTAGVYVVTDDPDGVRERGLTTGAEVGDIVEQDYGSRDVQIRDPEGNLWSFGTYRGEPRT